MRFSPHTQKEREEMLMAIGVKDIDELISASVGQQRGDFSYSALKKGMSEMEVINYIESIAERNRNVNKNAVFIGAGAYQHFIPQIVPSLSMRSEFLTSYTPYQAEASQGNLQAMFEFQTMITELYGMDCANSSMYDGASALAEAALMTLRINKRKVILISKSVHPEYRETLKTYCTHAQVIEVEIENGMTNISDLILKLNTSVACMILQYPNFFGLVEDIDTYVKLIHACGGMVICNSYPIAMGLLQPPGELGVDIVVGDGQPLGVPLSYGGPYVGLFACKKKYVRNMPGRIVGLTKDKDGNRGFTLTLQTREQHIKRERSTSNICTNHTLIALMVTVYLSIMGPSGMAKIANINFQKAHYLYDQLLQLKNFSAPFGKNFFNECVIQSKIPIHVVQLHLQKNGILILDLGRFYPCFADCFLFCVTEINTQSSINRLIQVLHEIDK